MADKGMSESIEKYSERSEGDSRNVDGSSKIVNLGSKMYIIETIP